MALSPCSFFPLLLPFCTPFLVPLLTWNPPCCDRICPPWSQVPRKLISTSPSLPICSPSVSHSEIPTPCGLPELMRPFNKTTSQYWLPGPAQHDYLHLPRIALLELISIRSREKIKFKNYQRTSAHYALPSDTNLSPLSQS